MCNILNDENIEIQQKNSFSTKTLKCPVCGNFYYKNKKGRTKEYCSNNCQEFNKFKEAMVKRMRNIDFKLDEAILIRRELWGYANIAKLPTNYRNNKRK